MTAAADQALPPRVALEELTPTIVAAFADDTCLIWSSEHRRYWRAGGRGYAAADYDAGRFTLDEAYLRTKHCDPSKGIMFERAAGNVEHLKKQLHDERALTRRLSDTNRKLSGAVEAAPPVALTAGSWWYPDGDTSSDSCMFSASEVVDHFVEGFDGRAGVCVIERAVSLPDVYAAVRVLTEDECELLGVDDEVSYTLFATREAAEAAVAAMMNDGAAEVTP
ncbi:hypothetical protein SFC76_03150 [Sphingomonas sp. CD22]|uniref:hypothetical protein n=1 Tax=Sphingomonas sp. CD22 TaxID=3100214 RepID=UPI002ADF8CC0|nr:hypothetical protein [Sphingomonas sp. CD22]MEA1083246.1 hypothetical protein [Sphingomonas sp. CD22]